MVGVGIVGAGLIGSLHAQVAALTGEERVVAVCDPRREQAEAVAASSSGRAYASIDHLLADPAVEAVVVGTPTHLHRAHVIAALAAGKHVFCEKPLANTVAECDDILAAAAAHPDLVLMVGHVVRFWPEYLALKRLVDEGALGTVREARFERLIGRPTWLWNNWSFDPALSPGAPLDLQIHDLDFVCSLLGRPRALQGLPVAPGSERHHFHTRLVYDGAAVYLEGGWDYPTSFPFTTRYRVSGDRGLAHFDNHLRPPLTVFPEDGAPSHPGASEVAREGSPDQPEFAATYQPYLNEHREWLACMREGRQPTTVTPEDARYAVRLALASVESARRGSAEIALD